MAVRILCVLALFVALATSTGVSTDAHAHTAANIPGAANLRALAINNGYYNDLANATTSFGTLQGSLTSSYMYGNLVTGLTSVWNVTFRMFTYSAMSKPDVMNCFIYKQSGSADTVLGTRIATSLPVNMPMGQVHTNITCVFDNSPILNQTDTYYISISSVASNVTEMAGYQVEAYTQTPNNFRYIFNTNSMYTFSYVMTMRLYGSSNGQTTTTTTTTQGPNNGKELCCVYTVQNNMKSICTSDSSCPQIKGADFDGSYHVNHCDDCYAPHQN